MPKWNVGWNEQYGFKKEDWTEGKITKYEATHGDLGLERKRGQILLGYFSLYGWNNVQWRKGKLWRVPGDWGESADVF